MKVLLSLFAAVAGLAAASSAEAKRARCVVTVEKRVMMNGPCDFQAEGRDGSFSLAALDRRAWLTPEIGSLALRVTAPGRAEVFVVGERASRWGAARRSRSDRACWIGTRGNFKICAY